MDDRDSRPGWLDDPGVRPTVLLLGGFMTAPPMYRSLRRLLLERGAAEVVVASIWPPDWLLVALRGHRAIVARSARALLAAGRIAGDRSKGAPVLVIGHSAGGVHARILTSPVPFEGRSLGGSERIGAIVTLGSPHRVGSPWRARGDYSTFAEEHVPGAFWAPRVGYLAVASCSAPGVADGTGPERWRWRTYRRLVPPDAASARPDDRLGAPARIDGDGVVPLECAVLEGARSVIFDDVDHGTLGRWYGSSGVLDGWWPIALDVWRRALDARRAVGSDLVSPPPAPVPA